ncbi:zf-HC2 domain-containing protein [Kitasatospora sp. RB6PN24]|uniref:anti-sigma factor family protein n=1 Tax=Kitasatospora humi TaxID=2893891 RepID=UPI001E31C293|nr:zf-HC2 domain-containing protein [Kitasatospora humi]MCC9307381.1 zf-HC2 domain-containing protein [Kitasatospora humi]
MNRSAACAELGAYVLGGLDEAERDRFEEHLLTCDYCLGEADSFQKVRDLLLPLVGQPVEPVEPPVGYVDVPTPGEAPPVVPDDSLPDEAVLTEGVPNEGMPDEGVPDEGVRTEEALTEDVLTELLADLARERHRRTWRVAAALTAGAALLLALPFVTLCLGGGSVVGPPAAGPTPSPAVMLMMTGEQHRAADPVTRVSGAVALEDKAWGTHVALRLSGIGGPLTCSLVAVSKGGRRETVTNWSVPPVGYGTPGHPDDLVVHGGTSLSHGQLDHFEVRTADGRELLSIPV